MTRVRELIEDHTGFDRDLWRRAAGLGWFGLLADEEHGGGSLSGNGLVDASIVAEELGRALMPGPFIGTSVVVAALTEFGPERERKALVPQLVSGELVGAWAAPQPVGRGNPLAVSARSVSEGYVLDGVVPYVEFGAQSDLLLVSAEAPEGPTTFILSRELAGVTFEELEAIDLTRRLADLHLDGVEVDSTAIVGSQGEAGAQIERLLQLALVLQCADATGATSTGFERTVEYSKERLAFGRPIGSYQALKHRTAWHRIQLEGAFATTAYAAESVGGHSADAGVAARIAKAHVGKWSSVILQDCMQMHGGIAVTWEFDLHLFSRRALHDEVLFGTPSVHHQGLVDLAEEMR